MWKPGPMGESTKSTRMGFTLSYNSLPTRYVIPFSVNTMSSSVGSSGTMPKEGPPQPPPDASIRMEGISGRDLKNSLIISVAFSVTSSIFSSMTR